MGGSSSKPSEPVNAQPTSNPSDLISALSAQAASAQIAQQAADQIRQLQAQKAAAEAAAAAAQNKPLFSNWKFWGIMLFVIGIVAGAIYGIFRGFKSALTHNDISGPPGNDGTNVGSASAGSSSSNIFSSFEPFTSNNDPFRECN